MPSALQDFVNELGEITSVIGRNALEPVTEIELGHFDEVQFVCQRGIFTVAADGEFDSVNLMMSEGSKPFKREISQVAPWKQVIGKPILWAWLLTNQQGFMDGFQFEVTTSDGYVAVQLMCEASSLSVRLVTYF
jgi:hypothetical protein